MADPSRAPFGAVLLNDVVRATDIDPDYPDATDGDFHLVRRHFDIRAFGVNAITGDAGDEMVEPHHEGDDEANRIDGHEELFAVMGGTRSSPWMERLLTPPLACSCSYPTRISSEAPGLPSMGQRSSQ
jgi:hypothetical protein